MSRQFTKFLLTSGIAAGVNIAFRAVFSLFLIYDIAIVIAYILGMITAFILAKLYVFDSSGKPVQREMIGFILINIVALVQVWVVSVGLARWLFPMIGYEFYPELTAHIIGVASPAFTSYFGHKYVSFGKGKKP